MERCSQAAVRGDGSETSILSGKLSIIFFILLDIGKLTVQRLVMQMLVLRFLAISTQRKT